MQRHLTQDFFRRMWPIYAGTCAALALLWATAGSSPRQPGFFVALSLSATFVLGPLIALADRPADALFLPLPRRDAWRAMWFLGTIVAVAGTTIAKIAGAALGALLLPDRPPATIPVALSSLLDFAYAGVLLALLPLIRASETGSQRRVARAVSAAAQVMMSLAFLLSILWGFLLQSYLPTEWRHLRGPSGSLVFAGVGVALAAFFYVPPAGARQSRSMTDAGMNRAGRASPRWLPFDRLTGLQRMLVHETSGIAVSFVGMIVFVTILGTFIEPRAGFIQELRWLNLLPFATADRSASIFPLVIFGTVIMNARLGLTNAAGPSLRQLRVLPMTTAGLTSLLLGRRVLGWLAIWTGLLAVHLVTMRALPGTLRPELLTVCVGADALVYAIQIRWRDDTGLFAMARVAAMLLGFGLVLILPLRLVTAAWADTLLMPIGLSAAAAAAWTIHRALSRSSSLYAPAPRKAALGEGIA